MKEKLKTLLEQYGTVALVIWFTIFGLSIATFSTLLSLGFEVEGAAGATGTLAGAYLATQVIKPIRIAATLALTPLVATWVARVRGQPVPAPMSRDAEDNPR